MHKPGTIQYLYLDFDGFFAALHEQMDPTLHGKPVGVLPFSGTTATSLIAANAMAKRMGIKMGMRVPEARRVCPGIRLVSQAPDMYEEMHRKLLLVVEKEIPITAVCSIDELTCRLDAKDAEDPVSLARRIKARISAEIGPYVTCSIGMAPNAQLAKIAGEMDKPDGLTILRPEDLPGRLLSVPLGDLPGIGSRMRKRLIDANIWSVEALWNMQPKQMRALWGNVTGERFWYALHGYETSTEETERRMFGHSRVLPSDWRHLSAATEAARLLTVKATRRLRRSGYCASRFGLYLKGDPQRWFGEHYMGHIDDDYSALAALHTLVKQAEKELPSRLRIRNVSISLYSLTRKGNEQQDMFLSRTGQQDRWAALSNTMDHINNRYAKTMVSMGPWPTLPGGYAGGKIAFGRVPEMEDFW